jgi:hypothetical protein
VLDWPVWALRVLIMGKLAKRSWAVPM